MSKSWTATLRLPKSTFPPRPLAQFTDQYIRKSADDLYQWQKTNRPAQNTFVLHDGPPYANGSLHVGHALNKILKDMILRVKVQQGSRVDYVPGWDCHGLPIELKALGDSSGKDVSPMQIRKTARNLASSTVLKQMKAFRSYGVMADWEQRWTTMDAAFELRQLRLFQQMVKRGLIYRKYKPVYWSPSSRTALAEAELEYKDDHVSTSAWIKFPMSGEWRHLPALEAVAGQIAGQLSAVVWTTTPWTLPANQAIAVHDELEYCIVQDGEEGYIVALSQLEFFLSKTVKAHVAAAVPTPPTILRLPGSQLKDLKYYSLTKGKTAPTQPLIHADFVSADSGSGLVHLAPGHGFDDYDVCSALGLPVTAPIDDEGRFTEDAFPAHPGRLTEAPSINDGGSQVVLELLGDAVLAIEKYTHKYPYDWRTKQPVVIRATEQWFADVASIKCAALEALEAVNFIPDTGKRRLESFIKGRSEWCISRQRSWGVPIPALYDRDGAAVMTEATIEHIVSVIKERGTSAWWSDPLDERVWIPPTMAGEHRRGTETMDVWFDSGSSWTIMSGQADLCLEGSDQHRGWFQSSLLTRIAAGAPDGDSHSAKEAPFKELITHGFTLDQHGKKMSKSLGNIIAPDEVMDGTLLPPLKRKGKAAQGPTVYPALGSDALRLWVASSDYTKDVIIGAPVLQTVHTALIKYRTILKMLLGSMHSCARTAPLTATDHIALVQLQDTMKEVGKAFGTHEFYKAFNILNRWITVHLSTVYLEALKDRLYCGDGGGILEPIFTGFLRMLAPMTPSLVEEAWDHRPDWMRLESTLVDPLQQLYTSPIIDASRVTRDLSVLRQDIPILMTVHAAIKAGLEQARTDKMVGSSLQSSVSFQQLDAGTAAVLERYADELDSMFVVSSVVLDGSMPASPAWSYAQDLASLRGRVVVLPPGRAKCPRCWRYLAPVEDQLCVRCEQVTGGVQ